MSFTTPIYIPLVDGLDLSKDATLTGHELQIAENVDFAVQGQVRGRPSRTAPGNFIVRTASATYNSAVSFANTGFRANGLMRLRDGTSERPMLGTDGRLFVRESTEWKDRGAFACFKVDQPHVYFRHDSATLDRLVMGPDFGGNAVTSTAGQAQMSLLNPTTLGFERNGSTISSGGTGTMARCGTMTATVYVASLTNNLRLLTRSNGATTFADTIIAADAAAASHDGDAPVICCDEDQTVFFVIYQTTTANQYKVLKVTTAGSVSATFTGTLTGIHGHWVANSTVANNLVVIGLTNADGLTVKVLNATTMGDNAKDSTHGTVACDAREVVVGVESSTRAWWAYRSNQNAAGVAGLRIGTANPGTAASAALLKTYYSVSDDATSLTSGVGYYTPLHGPVKFGGRMYLSLACLNWVNVPTASSGVGTWFTIDLSNLTTVGAFANPTLVARGRTDAFALRGTSATQKTQPEGAVLLSDSTGWTFPSAEWRTYNLGNIGYLLGESAVQVLNKVSLSGPRAVLAGTATLISGSIVRSLAGDECFEAGFPLVRPYLAAAAKAGVGSLAAGSYTVYTCWTYTDGGGQIHRSATVGTTVTAALNDAIDVYVQTPYFHERTDVKLEVYCTGASPAAEDPAYLQSTFSPAASAGATKYRISTVTTGTRNVYSLTGEFQHVTPCADGGIAALGRRVWVADRGSVYASLLLQPNQGATWNDEGSLQVDLPAGAGRVLALEGLDDKLIIFCERGVYAIQDGGPNNVGQGPDLSFPIRLTDLSCAGPRSTCVTDRGVVFSSPLDSTDPQRGGPWLLDRSLSLTERKYLGTPALSYFLASGSWVPEVAFSAERQQLYVSVPSADGAGTTGVVVIDLRNSKWSTWVHQASQGAFTTMDCISGVLWTKGTEVAAYSGAPGADNEGNYMMRLQTGHIFADGRNGLGWARCRAVSTLSAQDAGAHDMTIIATQDHVKRHTSSTYTLAAVPAPGNWTWPTDRQAPEFRLPSQKCSTLQVELRATPATAKWAAIRLDVQPLPHRAPTAQRA